MNRYLCSTVILGATLSASHVYAEAGISLDARGPGTTLVSISGVDTADAKIVSKLTQKNFDDCNNVGGQACATGIFEADQTFIFQANCVAETVIDRDGRTYRRIGTWDANEDGAGYFEGRPKFVDAAGRTAYAVNASNGGGLAMNFEAACPSSEVRKKTRAVRQDMPLHAAAGSMVVSLSSLAGNAYDHNGSQMRIDRDNGMIVYEEPKSSIAGTVKEGQVLFRGKLPWRSMKASGTAYTFKRGCAPAPYSVTGYWNANQDLILVGSAPKRAEDGCAVTGYSKSSGNSKLVFKSLMSD